MRTSFRHSVPILIVVGVLVLVGGGVAVAAATIGSDDVINGSLKSEDIKDGTLKSVDIKNGQIQSADVNDGSITATDVHNESLSLRRHQERDAQDGRPLSGCDRCASNHIQRT